MTPTKLGLALVLLTAVVACQPTPAVVPTPVPTASASPSPTPEPTATPGTMLSGRWLTGTGEEPPAGPKSVNLNCGYEYSIIPELQGPAAWEVQQINDQLTFTSLPERMQGPTGPNPACPSRGELGSGTVTGNQVMLNATATVEATTCFPPADGQTQPTPGPSPTSEPVTYVLTYNPATRHLTGTRNSKPFWAVPLDVSGPPPSCGPMAVP